jgi:hypothetical protein
VPYLDQDLAGLVAGWIAAADAFLLGRGTYELFVGHWPLVTGPTTPSRRPSTTGRNTWFRPPGSDVPYFLGGL